MTGVWILIACLLSLCIAVIALYVYLVRRHPKLQDYNRRFYDQSGNHLYYDRKLIAHLEKQNENK